MELNHREFEQCHKTLKKVLAEACNNSERSLDSEIDVVLGAAWAWGAEHDVPIKRITRQRVVECDRMASGHVDWSSKFPLYVAERIYGLKVVL